MRQDLLASMQCPYCDGDFTIAKCVRGDAERIHYGLIECRCFRFPIVDGVLLLSMAKGYGGAEEALQPYAPLQVAAMKFLDDGDVEGFEQWISRHLPLATKLLSSADDANDTYMETAARLHDAGAE